jgi:F0F1-type ATP synthase membrane subunit b/b'
MIDGLNQLGFHLPSLIIYSINFAILTGVLYAIAFRPMLAGIRKRTAERTEAEALLLKAEADVVGQHSTALAALNEARREAASIIDAAMRQARAESREAVERGLAQASARSASDLHAQRDRVHAEGAALAVTAAEQILRQALGPETQQALLASALREIADTELDVSLPLQTLITVTSAVALTPDEWSAVGEALRSLFGEYPAAVHHVRPELLGGLTVEVGDTLIDATVLGKLHHLQADLEQADSDVPD